MYTYTDYNDCDLCSASTMP
ncbi:unnamed protein product, partial [Rotaria sp. Silwood2]